MWGVDSGAEILRDSWIFHLNQQQWKKVVFNIIRNIPSIPSLSHGQYTSINVSRDGGEKNLVNYSSIRTMKTVGMQSPRDECLYTAYKARDWLITVF